MAPTRDEEEEEDSNGEEEEEEEEWNEEEGDDGSSDSESSAEEEEEWDEEEEEASLRNRSLLWLCQEGQIRFARLRFNRLLREGKTDQLKREIFQQAPPASERNYPIHELLMGGTSDRNAHQLTQQILQYCQENHPHEYRQMLLTQPPSHKRTALHWAAWGNADKEIMEILVRGNPEALVLRDSADRTPAEIYKYYYCSNRIRTMEYMVYSEERGTLLEFLERVTKSWTQHRLRLTIHLCTLRYFSIKSLTPFDKDHRKNCHIKPKPWFILSILGTLMQREMKPILNRILQYTGGDASSTTTRRRGGKRKQTTKKQKKQQHKPKRREITL